MYWQADDTWPGPSWATIEYGGRPKVGHYAVQRAFAPLMVSGRVGSDGQLDVYFSRSGPHDLPGGGDNGDGDAPAAMLRVTAFRWSGGHGALELPVPLPAAHSTAKLLSRGIDAVLGSIKCDGVHVGAGTGTGSAARCCASRSECVLRLEVVMTTTVAGAADEVVLASNTVYLSPFHQVTTMTPDPGLAVRPAVIVRQSCSSGRVSRSCQLDPTCASQA